jgi:hypothetical protein
MSRVWMRAWMAVVAAVGLCACTTVGLHTRPPAATFTTSPPLQLRVCVLQADGVSARRAQQLVAAVNREFAPYGIEVVVPWTRPWQRPGFTYHAMFDDVARRELEPPCDRLVAFVDRNVGDFVWSLVMPEVLGAVDDDTHTRGFVVATRASLNQLLASPAGTAVHEFYHLLGCPHAATLTACYERIAALKRQIAPGADFVPGVGRDGRFLLSREEANRTLRGSDIASAAMAAEAGSCIGMAAEGDRSMPPQAGGALCRQP